MLRGQIDISARVIWFFEKLGWVWDVKWPTAERIASRRVDAATARARERRRLSRTDRRPRPPRAGGGRSTAVATPRLAR